METINTYIHTNSLAKTECWLGVCHLDFIRNPLVKLLGTRRKRELQNEKSCAQWTRIHTTSRLL